MADGSDAVSRLAAITPLLSTSGGATCPYHGGGWQFPASTPR